MGNPKALAIKDELDDYYGSEVNHGRLYPNLDTLVDKGIVDKRKKDDRTNQYSLRTRGRREIKPHQVESGMRNLVDKIQTHDPNRIAFVGKNAATWFYRYAENKDITHSQASGHKTDR